MFLIGTFTSLLAQQPEATLDSEKGKALKEWFDAGDIIVEGCVEDQVWVTTGPNYLCDKFKIIRILKGDLKKGSVNLQIPGYKPAPPSHPEDPQIDIQYPSGYDGPGGKGSHFILVLKKSPTLKECFSTENKGVYTFTHANWFKLGAPIDFTWNKSRKNYVFSNTTELYLYLQKFCGVDIKLPKEKKSPDAAIVVKSDISYQQKVKNYTEYMQQLEIRLHQKKNISNQVSSTNCVELFISEMLEPGNPSSKNKVLEIFNPANSAKSLTNYSIRIYQDGTPTPLIIPLTGTIAAKGTHVVSHPLASSAILAKTDQTDVNMIFDGNDAITLNRQNSQIDKIGEIGVNPGNSGWYVPVGGSTAGHDLRRKFLVDKGDTIWNNTQNQWDIFPSSSMNDIKQHQNICASLAVNDLILAFANPVVNGNYFEFDIMASANNSSTYFDNALIRVSYNTTAFGTNIVSSGNVTITKGATFNSATYLDPNSNAIDQTSSVMGVPFGTDFNQSSWNRTLLTTTPVQLLHFKMKVAACPNPANIDFADQSFTPMFSYYTTTATDNIVNSLPYDNTLYSIGLTTNIPCGLQITGFTPNSVVAGAFYTGIVSNNSQLTINGTGFGTTQGTVYMKNAVHNSQPYYIPLDAYDITSWTSTQIVLNVPSVLFPNPNPNPNYPGTGYIYVKPFGASDSAQSPTQVHIPYVLKNVSINSGTAKRRISFAYRNVIDSAGMADTAVYCFRFDSATVTGNPNSFCRPLLKQAVQDWACGIPIRYRIGKDTTISNAALDGISYITFSNTLSNINFIAETGIKAQFCAGPLYSTEADITFRLNPLSNGQPDWFYVNPSLVPLGSATGNTPSGYTDFFQVALHELGHATLLEHINDTAALMYFKVFQNVPRSYISSDDQSGGMDNITWSKTLTFGSCTYSPFAIPSSGSTACVNVTNGVEQIGKGHFEFSVYPNPTGDYLNVTFTKTSMSKNTIRLTDVSGQVLYYKNIGSNEGAQEVINLKNYAKGIYILTVTDNEHTINRKIILQ